MGIESFNLRTDNDHKSFSYPVKGDIDYWEKRDWSIQDVEPLDRKKWGWQSIDRNKSKFLLKPDNLQVNHQNGNCIGMVIEYLFLMRIGLAKVQKNPTNYFILNGYVLKLFF